MNICGIISEFNPFTNGHKYIINKAKQETNLDILCLMSGNFVQRGEAAILDKYERATIAINNGASYILELPLCYALSSAQNFASGAIKILNKIPNVTHLAFGVEIDNPKELEEVALLKVKESQELKLKIKEESKKGLNYNKALVNALKSCYPEKTEIFDKIFNSANNILAVEYLTAIYKQKSKIEPVYIKRLDNGYNSTKPTKIKIDNKSFNFASATYIRKLVESNKTPKIKKLVPTLTYEKLMKLNNISLISQRDKLDAIIINNLRQEKATSLYNYYDYNQSLAHLILTASKENSNSQDIINKLISKTFRASRVKKLLLYPTFNLTNELYKLIDNNLDAVNVLAVAENKKKDLSLIKKNSKINLIISNKDYTTCKNKELLDLNQKGSDIYNIISNKPNTQDQTIFIK